MTWFTDVCMGINCNRISAKTTSITEKPHCLYCNADLGVLVSNSTLYDEKCEQDTLQVPSQRCGTTLNGLCQTSQMKYETNKV